MTGQQPRVEPPGRSGASGALEHCEKCGAELDRDSAGNPYCVKDGRNYKVISAQGEST